MPRVNNNFGLAAPEQEPAPVSSPPPQHPPPNIPLTGSVSMLDAILSGKARSSSELNALNLHPNAVRAPSFHFSNFFAQLLIICF